MKVLFAASEAAPYASTGGLADVAGALPEALQREGMEVIRVMPCYRQVLEFKRPIKDTGLRLAVPVGLDRITAEVWVDSAANPPTYFIRRDEFFDRTHLYGPATHDYEDNAARFVFFQKAVVALLDRMPWPADLVHANDWQTALIPTFLKYGIDGRGRAGREKTVFTIHNLAFQGLFAAPLFPLTNLPLDCFSIRLLEYYGQMNWMKAGIIAADRVTTVSPHYAEEIKTESLGCGLHGVLRDKGPRLTGIVNGVCYADWNPATDHYLRETYDHDRLEGKLACKRSLLAQMKMPVKTHRPLLGLVSRLAEQKGLDILAEAMEKIMDLDAALVILGTGQDQYHQLCQQWAARWPGRVGVRLLFDTALAHRIEAGADIFLMPSRFEPCGMNQLYSLRYGTLPVVHATGGLVDTITDVDADPDHGNGFSFAQYSAAALVQTTRRAVDFFAAQPRAWKALMRRVMREDHSWAQSAREYAALYRQSG